MYGLLRRKVPAGEARKRAVDALRQVQLADYAARIPAQLSGGQQQRVAIARAFVTKPAMLLLDEPLGALDRRLREALQIEFRKLTRQLGITSIFVTHDQHEAIVLSDRIAVMNRGRIEQADRPDAIFERPATPFVAKFLGVSNLFSGRIVSQQQVEIADGLRLPARSDHPLGTVVRLAYDSRTRRCSLLPMRRRMQFPAVSSKPCIKADSLCSSSRHFPVRPDGRV